MAEIHGIAPRRFYGFSKSASMEWHRPISVHYIHLVAHFGLRGVPGGSTGHHELEGGENGGNCTRCNWYDLSSLCNCFSMLGLDETQKNCGAVQRLEAN